MTAPGYTKQPIIQRLPTLLDEIRQGELLVPRFQRPFIWSDEQRLDLLDSAYRGLPIGSIIVWRTKDHALACHDQLGPLSIAAHASDSREVKQYLLDGHQRLATLYAAFNYPIGTTKGNRETDDSSEARWPMYFDLRDQRFKLEPRTSDAPATWLPLSIVFDPYKLYEFEKKLFDHKHHELAEQARNLADTLRDYQIAVVPIVTEELGVVTTSFQRINSAGTKMSEVHMVNALTWSQEFDLNDRISRVQKELEVVGWGDLDGETILNTCKALLGVDVYDSRLEDITKEVEQRQYVIEEAGTRLTDAARFLDRSCHIRGPAMLPYRLQMVFIASVLRPPSEDEELLALRRWLWVTTYLEYFGPGINATKVRNELERLPLVLEGGTPVPPGSMKRTVFSRRFDFRAARSRAMAVRMAELEPRLPNGQRFDAFQLLADAGHKALPFVIHTSGIRSSAESRVVLPQNELLSLRELMRPRPQISLFMEGSEDPHTILQSHAIDPEACDALADGRVNSFLCLRRQRLFDIERVFVESLGLEYGRQDTETSSP